jgi:hypothetical protein
MKEGHYGTSINKFSLLPRLLVLSSYDAPPSSLMDSTANPKVETTEGE